MPQGGIKAQGRRGACDEEWKERPTQLEGLSAGDTKDQGRRWGQSRAKETNKPLGLTFWEGMEKF